MSISANQLQAILDEIADTAQANEDKGRVADYIPELAGIDPNQFAIAVAIPGQPIQTAGDARKPFSIQSVSKVFTLALALGKVGDQLWQRVGREPSGQAFDSVILLEQEKGRPRNPFINAGAIVTTDDDPRRLARRSETLGTIMLRFVRAAADDDNIHYQRKRCPVRDCHRASKLSRMAHYLHVSRQPRQRMPARTDAWHLFPPMRHRDDLRTACQCRAFPRSVARRRRGMVSQDRIRRINALMMTCGHYDGSGDYAYRVGLPGKSGVGGGILSIVPGVASVAVWSPGLNRYGNSKLGTEAMQMLAERTGWSVFL